MSTVVTTLLVQGGYYPDRFAEEHRGPDVFFITVDVPLWVTQGMEDDAARWAFWAETIAEACDDIHSMVCDKYKRKGDVWGDIFWSIESRFGKVDDE